MPDSENVCRPAFSLEISGGEMAKETAERFIEALHQLEENEEVDAIVGLFDEECEIGNVTLTKNLSGTEGAREFWTNYRKTFGQVHSIFKNKIISDNTAALEWTTEGTNQNGGEISYEGVSVLEIENGKIKRFFAYFNPSKLGHQIEETKASAG
jgi:hypothetical protein